MEEGGNVVHELPCLSYSVLSCNVCPNFNYMDLSHVSTSMSQKTNMKKMVPSNSSFDQENMCMPLPNSSGSAMDFDNNFWNITFDKKNLKHKNRLDVIFVRPPLETRSVNTFSGHVVSNLHNCPISITYDVDPKSSFGLSSIVDRT
jgi:hypothetical protein